MDKSKKFVLWFDELKIEDVPLVGGKNASLGEMYRELSKKGVPIPYGFAITAHSYQYILEKAGVEDKIKQTLKGLNVKNMSNLSERGRKVREIIRNCEFPPEVAEEIHKAYKRLCKKYGKDTDVAVRSSATAEDLPDASFAGQQETYLNIRGEHALIDACKNCFASLFTNRAIVYRQEKGFDHFKVYLSIGVQKMVRSDLATSGVMFTLDTETGFPDTVFVTGAYGLGENVVQGAVNPDEFHIFKPTLKKGFKPVISKAIGGKEMRMIYSDEGKHPTKNIPVPMEERNRFCMTDKEALQLAKWGMIVEEHYTKKRGKWTPMDLEWAKDGKTGKLFIVQARPETVQSQKSKTVLEEFRLLQKGKLLVIGKSVGNKIGQGKASVIKDVKDIKNFKEGDVLVTEMTDPDWVPIMRMASAIVTNRGGRTCHAAIVSRELGIPCVVGTIDGTKHIKAGQKITVSCSEGEEGKVYQGLLKFTIKKINLKKMPQTRTKIMMNVGNPEEAFEQSFIPNSGVGLAREEFIINSYIKIHPNALMDYPKVPKEVKEQIDRITAGQKDKKQFFVDQLARGVANIAAAFYPNDVIVRMSDFKSNEYANLVGGQAYEPSEDNPMIGWRGASRYYSEKYKKAFALECKALKKAREEFGLTNIKLMIPFCRTVEEGKKVIAEMKKNGLVQGKKGLQVYVMCEIPSNVVLAEQFAKVFDGFSIGTNDLTQLTLGLDRDSALVADLYDERNEAVRRLVHYVIHEAKKAGKKIGICGDAPSTYPEFAQFLVECGIDSMSLTPDAVVKTTLVVAEIEKKMKKHKFTGLKTRK